jgi:hypothetical protein
MQILPETSPTLLDQAGTVDLYPENAECWRIGGKSGIVLKKGKRVHGVSD